MNRGQTLIAFLFLLSLCYLYGKDGFGLVSARVATVVTPRLNENCDVHYVNTYYVRHYDTDYLSKYVHICVCFI